MEKKEKKIFKHPFLDKYTKPGVLVVVIIGVLISQAIFGPLFAEVVQIVVDILVADAPDVTDMAVQIGSIIGVLLVLALFRRWFYPEYEGGFKGGARVTFWSLLGVAIMAALFILMLITDFDKMGMPSMVNIAAAFMAGICEEAIYRGMGASYLMRQWCEEKKIRQVIFVSAFIFAIVHAFNLLAGAPIIMTVIQVINAFAIGCFFCTLFVRSGSLIPSMIMHTLNDILAFTDVASISEGGAYNSTATVSVFDTVSTFVIDALFIGLTIYLTRPAVRGLIREIWGKKWRNIRQSEY